MKTAHDVKLLNGSKQEVSYTGVETVTMPGTDGQDKVFTAGMPIDSMDISPDLSGGDMPLEAPEGYVVRSATIKKPEGAEQVIAKGQTLVGIVGEYVTPGTTKEITPDFSGGDQTVAAGGDERWTEVTVKKPEGLVPDNIADGVEIAGVVGAYKNEKAPHQIVDGTSGFEITDSMFDAVPTYVQSYAFMSNSALTRITLSRAIGIGSYAFASCSGLTTANFPACTSIGSWAFYICTGLTTASFPACVTIESYAFNRCSGLTTANFPACTSIGNSAFYLCTGLTTASFPACTSIGSCAFSGCSGLIEASFPVCTSISFYAFSSCKRLQTASFPACKSIGYGAFSWCSAMSDLYFPVCTTISSMAFYACYNLKKAIFPSCTIIGSAAFSACSRLTTASFPACVTIESYAFRSCTRLISLYLLGSSFVTLSGGSWFLSTPISNYLAVAGRYGSIFVRESMLASYKASQYWSVYAARMVGLTDEEIAALDAAQEEAT